MSEDQTLSDYAAGEIRATLARRQMQGKELAAKLGVSRSWVSYRLTGTTEIGLNDLARIAAALEVSVTDLLPVIHSPSGLSVAHSQEPAGQPRRIIGAGCLTKRPRTRRPVGPADASKLHAASPATADRPTADRATRRPSWTCQAVPA